MLQIITFVKIEDRSKRSVVVDLFFRLDDTKIIIRCIWRIRICSGIILLLSSLISMNTVINLLSSRERSPIKSSAFEISSINSRYLVERFRLSAILEGHEGCVNTALFSEDGDFVITGSDDTEINLYRLHANMMTQKIPTIHTNNIFWAKDLPFSDGKRIVSCAGNLLTLLIPAF